jgi:DNA polymerase-3 subunit alpha
MAALLTSEMGDTDKIVKYIEECRAMGLTVSPPDVDVSAVQFSVAGDTIRFGLAAIKNVGEAAMESILATRAGEGPFKTLDDFCARVDLRLVNRRVIESLIKAGAFDSFGLPRAHLLAQTDAALESGQRTQRDRNEGQGSFFDALLSPAAAPARREPAEIVSEWPDDQRLAYEKEVLGFYISGHPLARYASVIDELGVTTSGDLATRGHGARVTLLGHVAALKETATKSGNRMAFVTLEDMTGTVEVTVFPEPFKAAAPYLRSREPLVVRGRVDDGDKGRVILAEDVRLLEQALGGAARPRAGGSEAGACRIRIVANGDPAPRLAALRKICDAHPGGVPVFVHVVLAGQEVVVRSRGCSVDATPALTSEVEALLGPATLSIDYA